MSLTGCQHNEAAPVAKANGESKRQNTNLRSFNLVVTGALHILIKRPCNDYKPPKNT